MDLLGAALPNIMFIVGILAVGLGLGIELKVISLNKEIDKTGRIGAFVAGLVLIGASVILYLNPSLANRNQTANAEAVPTVIAPAPTQAIAAAAAQPTQAPAPTSTAVPAQAPAPTSTAIPTQAPAPTSTAIPTKAPAPTSTAVPTKAPAPTQTPVLGVVVPNLHGKDDKGARDTLTKAGLKPQKVERCTGADKGDPKTKKNRVLCQNPSSGQTVAAGTTVEYVIDGK